MSKKSVLHSFGKVVVGLGVVLGIITCFLQIFEIFDFISLFVNAIASLRVFLLTDIPIFYVISFVIVFLTGFSAIRLLRKRGSKEPKNVLGLDYGRKLALLCMTPSTTEFPRHNYHL